MVIVPAMLLYTQMQLLEQLLTFLTLAIDILLGVVLGLAIEEKEIIDLFT